MKKKIIETIISIYNFDELETSQKQLIEKAKEQIEKAYAPYSKFYVGAAIELENGEVFAGSNQENSAYPSGLCAERVAMFFANAQYPDIPVKTIAIAASTNGKFLSDPISPCGSCRQVLLETETRFEQDIKFLLYGANHVFVIESVRQLLPLCFEKSSLKS